MTGGLATSHESYALGYVMVFGSQVYLKATLLWQWMLKASSDPWALIPDVQMLDSGVIRASLDQTVPKEIYPDVSALHRF